MFDRLRNNRVKAAASAGAVAIAALFAASESAADTKKTTTAVKIKSELSATAEVTFSGITIAGSSYQISPGGDARPLGNADDGATVKWVAKPKNDADKSKFTKCSGEKKVSGLNDTLVLTAKNCEVPKAAPAPSPAAPKAADSSATADKPGARAVKPWTVTLKGPDKASLDGNPWKIELFDAVACKAMSSVTLKKGGTATVSITAREGAGQASHKGEMGAHFRWKTSGVGPGSKAMTWWGDPKPLRNNAEVDIIVDPSGAADGKITGDCDK